MEQSPEDEQWRPLKFYSIADLSTPFEAERATAVLDQYDPAKTSYSIREIIELYNALLFLENDVLPHSGRDAAQRPPLQARAPALKRTLGIYFNSISDSSLPDTRQPFPHEYHLDLLTLLAQHQVFVRCSPSNLLPALDALNLQLGDLLTSRPLVAFADTDIRARLLARPENAEYIIRKHLQNDTDPAIFLPPSFSNDDTSRLLLEYIESEMPNFNYLKLVSQARVSPATGVSARTKLKARRKLDQLTTEYFNENDGFRTRCEVTIVSGQDDPARVEFGEEGLHSKFSYSKEWLTECVEDYPTLLNNFIYLFEFTDQRMLLTLPSFEAELGVLERVIGLQGKHDYRTSVAFDFKDRSSSLQLAMYLSFLQDHNIELEGVLAWFFTEYLKDHLDVHRFQFHATSSTSTNLEKCRHLFSEMESIARQYSLYVQDGEIDTALLDILSEQTRYNEVPSLLPGKYIRATESSTIQKILFLLFSDQSELRYISDLLQEEKAANLFSMNILQCSDFHEYQRPNVDYLIHHDILRLDEGRIVFNDRLTRIFLEDLYHHESVNYYHYSDTARRLMDGMVGKGWLMHDATLLTRAESAYFNYFLNQSQFSNGPDLRNKYVHGSNLGSSDDNDHFRTYLHALKLIIALVIKINDDLWLRRDRAEQADSS